MNEAERYLEEKLNPSIRRGSSPAQPSVMPTDTRVPSQLQTEPVHVKSTGNPAGKYVMAVLACLGIFGVYVAIVASMGWKRGGGYVVMVIVFMAIVGAWKAITRK